MDHEFAVAPVSPSETRRVLPAPIVGACPPTAEDLGMVLASMLRRALYGARGNPQIRERLHQVASDPERVGGIIRTLGARHTLVMEFRRLAEQPASFSMARSAR